MKLLSIKQENAIVQLTVKLGKPIADKVKADLGLSGIATVDLTASQAYHLISRLVTEAEVQKTLAKMRAVR
jgi:hypothetical protein